MNPSTPAGMISAMEMSRPLFSAGSTSCVKKGMSMLCRLVHAVHVQQAGAECLRSGARAGRQQFCYISPAIKNACAENRIPLIDVLQEDVPSIIRRLNVSVVYPAPASVCAQVPASVICANTEHGPRLLEKYADAYEWMYETSILKKSKAVLRFLLQRWIWPVKKEKERRGLCFPGLRLITVSEHSRYSMLSLFPDCAACKAMPVFYSPLFESVSGSDIDCAPLPEGIREKDYFLIVSGNRWIKNPLRAALAFDKLAGQGQLTKKIVITVVSHPEF